MDSVKQLFPAEVVNDLFSKVKGHSSLVNLSGSDPIPFTGERTFTFSMDKEADLVDENGAKTAGGATVKPVTVTPLKIEYGARVSEEFMTATQERKIEIMKSFTDGFAKKLGRAADIIYIHGVNPRTGAASTLVGDNCFVKAVTANVVTETDAKNADADMEAAVDMVEDNEKDVTGAVLAPSMRSNLAKLTITGGAKLYPELAWGSNPGSINGLPVDVNSTASYNKSDVLAVVGDFANAFKFGIAKAISFEVITMGNPDNDQEAGDLKGHDQVYLRCEAYIGGAILDADSFAIVKKQAA